MGVFRVTFTKDGRRQRSGKYYIDFKDAVGIRRRVPAYKGERESQELERLIEKLVACRQNNALPNADLLRSIESMPAKVRDRLMDFDVLDKRRRISAKSLAEHLLDYTAELIASGAGAKWAQTVRTRAMRVFDGAGFTALTDIAEGAVIVAADKVRRELSLSDQTYNHIVAACKAFTRWATPGRMNLDPLAKVRGRNAKANRVHARRALTADECRALLVAAESGPVSWTVPGCERALIYRLALESGLRANEIRTLTRSAFRLDGAQPSVTVDARNAKNRKTATIPLRPGLVGLLRTHLNKTLPAAPAFNVPTSSHTAEMLRGDLKAAGIDYEVEGRFVDFHALRHTFITNLALAGVMPNIAKELARHSTITLTMDYYTHTRLGDNASAIAKLPNLDLGKAAASA